MVLDQSEKRSLTKYHGKLGHSPHAPNIYKASALLHSCAVGRIKLALNRMEKRQPPDWPAIFIHAAWRAHRSRSYEQNQCRPKTPGTRC